MNEEEAKIWIDTLGPEELDAEVLRLLNLMVEGKSEAELIARFNAIPPTPKRRELMERRLQMRLEIVSEMVTLEMAAVHAEPFEPARRILEFDSQLNPTSWQPLMRAWARAKLKAAGDDWTGLTPAEDIALKALRMYLDKVG
jgi:hypothetical protein